MNIDKIRLQKELDRRRKLTDKQKERIKMLYNEKGLPIRVIARKYAHLCSRRLIQFVLFPERDKKLKEMRKKTKGHLKYYDKEKSRKAIASLRKYKREIFEIPKHDNKKNE